MTNTLATSYCSSCFFLIKRPRLITHSSQQQQQHQQQQQDTSNNYFLVINNNNDNSNSNNNSNNFVPPYTTNTSCFVSPPSSASPTAASTDYVEADDDMVPGMVATTPDLTTAYDSGRFFISSPGRSNTVVDSLPHAFPTSVMEATEVAEGVPMLIYSADPCTDFRRSMQEMVEARDLRNLKVKQVWEYLQELLFTYLALNQNNTHKYIVGAFTDLVVSIMSPNHNHSHKSVHPPSSCCGSGDHSIGSGLVGM